MKKTITAILILLCALSVAAQSRSVTKFLGIPVDGTKSAMITKLKAKGFKTYNDDMLTGEFNGVKSIIQVQTVNRKVWRIIVSDLSNRSESQIRIRYNNIFYQFLRNTKYTYCWGETLSEDESLSYNFAIGLDSKYQAGFYQNEDPQKKFGFV